MRKSLWASGALPARGLGKRHVLRATPENTAKPPVTLGLGIGIRRALLMHSGCGRNNPTPFEKFGWGGSGGGAGQGADSPAATPRTHAGLRAPQLPYPSA